MRQIEGVLYCNDGDWVESLTALVEHHDGRLEILDFGTQAAPVQSPSQFPVPAIALTRPVTALTSVLEQAAPGSRIASSDERPEGWLAG
jgi:glycine cleavage system regulatory protein